MLVHYFLSDYRFIWSQIPFMRHWFSAGKVSEMTVALWFKQDSSSDQLIGLVDNGDCVEQATFSIHAMSGDIIVGIDTDTWPLVVAGNQYVSRNAEQCQCSNCSYEIAMSELSLMNTIIVSDVGVVVAVAVGVAVDAAAVAVIVVSAIAA